MPIFRTDDRTMSPPTVNFLDAYPRGDGKLFHYCNFPSIKRLSAVFLENRNQASSRLETTSKLHYFHPRSHGTLVDTRRTVDGRDRMGTGGKLFLLLWILDEYPGRQLISGWSQRLIGKMEPLERCLMSNVSLFTLNKYCSRARLGHADSFTSRSRRMEWHLPRPDSKERTSIH